MDNKTLAKTHYEYDLLSDFLKTLLYRDNKDKIKNPYEDALLVLAINYIFSDEIDQGIELIKDLKIRKLFSENKEAIYAKGHKLIESDNDIKKIIISHLRLKTNMLLDEYKDKNSFLTSAEGQRIWLVLQHYQDEFGSPVDPEEYFKLIGQWASKYGTHSFKSMEDKIHKLKQDYERKKRGRR